MALARLLFPAGRSRFTLTLSPFITQIRNRLRRIDRWSVNVSCIQYGGESTPSALRSDDEFFIIQGIKMAFAMPQYCYYLDGIGIFRNSLHSRKIKCRSYLILATLHYAGRFYFDASPATSVQSMAFRRDGIIT